MPKSKKIKKGKTKISRKMKPIQSVINQVRNNYNEFIWHENDDWRNDIMKQEGIYYPNPKEGYQIKNSNFNLNVFLVSLTKK